ncbi:Uncharacterized protein TCM_001234 [Theobroma cacao]|uniref:Uncharacterized protein n=1 Tax=Theobroma cacao TaxID=3641 RepID=A0A061DIF0_THECC|nr:Uncharacterized protein TCM_001234 [Theobroma cacao]
MDVTNDKFITRKNGSGLAARSLLPFDLAVRSIISGKGGELFRGGGPNSHIIHRCQRFLEMKLAALCYASKPRSKLLVLVMQKGPASHNLFV